MRESCSRRLTTDSIAAPQMKRARAAELGSGRPHDTDRPDIETSSDRYATRRFSGAAGQWLLAQQSKAVSSLLDRMGEMPLKVLEIGGGHGQITPLLVARGHDVVVHGSAEGCFARIELARRAHPDRVTRCVANLWRLPFADASFDLVIAIRLLGHVVEWRELLAEMARVSRRFVVVEFARKSNVLALQSLRDAVFSLKHRVEGTTRPFFAYPEGALQEELRARRFEHVATVGQFAMPMMIHRVLRSPALSSALEGSLHSVGLRDGVRSPAILLAERGDAASGAAPSHARDPAAIAAGIVTAATGVVLPPVT
jgi:ubiquinone/menaquinone biosynthesis C-methylase UbiE